MIDKKNYIVESTSYGFYTDDNGTIYPFEYIETIENGERTDSSISWDDSRPENCEEIEEVILDEFADEDDDEED